MHEGLSRWLATQARAFSRTAGALDPFRIFDRCRLRPGQVPQRAQPVPAIRIRGPPPSHRSRIGVRNDAGPDGCSHRPGETTYPGTPQPEKQKEDTWK